MQVTLGWPVHSPLPPTPSPGPPGPGVGIFSLRSGASGLSSVPLGTGNEPGVPLRLRGGGCTGESLGSWYILFPPTAPGPSGPGVERFLFEKWCPWLLIRVFGDGYRAEVVHGGHSRCGERGTGNTPIPWGECVQGSSGGDPSPLEGNDFQTVLVSLGQQQHRGTSPCDT